MNPKQQKIILETIEDRIHQLDRLLEKSQTEENQDSTLQNLVNQKQQREYRDLKKQLERHEEGDLGFCQGCGQEIPYERLLALPAATYCVRCAN